MILSGAIQDEAGEFNGQKWIQAQNSDTDIPIKIYPFNKGWLVITQKAGIVGKNKSLVFNDNWVYGNSEDYAKITNIGISNNICIATVLGKGLIYSNDGISWSRISDSTIQNLKCTNIATGFGDKVWMVASDQGTYCTGNLDGLSNWKKTNDIINATFIKQVYGRWFVNNYYTLNNNSKQTDWSLLSTTDDLINVFNSGETFIRVLNSSTYGLEEGILGSNSTNRYTDSYTWKAYNIDNTGIKDALFLKYGQILTVTDNDIREIVGTAGTVILAEIPNGKKFFKYKEKIYLLTTSGLYYAIKEDLYNWNKVKEIGDVEIFDMAYQNGILATATKNGIYILSTQGGLK